MNLVNFGGLIGDAIADTWMSIWLSINSMVYSIIELLYKVFVAVANVNLFGEDVFNKIVKRVYIVMAIAMLFIFAYNLVLMIINPDDKKSTGQMTKMIKETIISLVLIVLLPTIFNYMSIFQRHVLDSNILGQIILGDVGGIASKDELTTYCEKYKKYTIIEDKTDIGDRRYNWGYVVGGTATGAVGGAGVGALIGGGAGLIASLADYFSQESKSPIDELYKGCLLFNAKSASSRGAATIAPTIFSAFYHPTKYGYFECADFIENGVGKYDSYTTNYIKTEDDKKMCSYYYYSVNMAKFTGSISAFNEESYFYSKVKKDDGTFEFNYILALVAGVLAVYMFACYTMSIGVRVAKLGFLQIISPLTVMMRIIPKKKEAIYDKWQKMLLDTYLDVFIRLLIIYFSLFSISLVPDVIHTLFSSFEGGGITGALVNALACVIVILGILKFAQDAPGLFKEFFGGSGSFALKSPSKQLSENKLAMGGLGMAKGAIGGSLRNGFKSYREGKGIGGALLSGAGGLIGGARRGARAGYGSTTENFNRNVDRSIEETTEKRRERAKYKALHGGTVGGVIKGHFGDAIAAHSAWTGFDGGRDILDTIKYEEDVISHFDDYESMYKSGGYATMDARLKEMKAAKKSNQGYDGIPLSELGNAIQNLEKEMQQSRIEAIKKNVQNAAYVAYEFSQSLNSDPKELARIRDKLKLSDAQIDQLKGLQIKNNKVVDANGNAVSEDLIVKLLEGEDIAYTVGTDGKVEVTSTSSKGLNGSSGDLKGQLSADKLSVAYKHQTKLEQERKDKK